MINIIFITGFSALCTVVSRAVIWRLYSAMLRPHQKVRLIDSFISSFENSVLDLINNRKKRYCGDSYVKTRLCRVLCEVFNYKSSVLITIMACTMPVYFSVFGSNCKHCLYPVLYVYKY